MKILKQTKSKRLTLLAGLFVGISLFMLFKMTQKNPAHDTSVILAPILTVIEVRAVNFRLEAQGFGVSRPAESWHAVANVSGRVLTTHPGLKSGVILPAGTELLAIDPSRYELTIAEAKADLASLTAELTQLQTEKSNTLALLNLAHEQLTLSEQELSRFEKLVSSDSVSISGRDEKLRATVAQRQELQSLENQLAVMPMRQSSLKAKQLRAEAKLKQAQQDLADTHFIAPYAVRISKVEVEKHQHISSGQQLFSADNIEKAEVEAQIPLTELRRLMAVVSMPLESSQHTADISERFNFEQIDGEVRLVGSESTTWPANITRIASGLTPRTRSGRVVVNIDEPYRDVKLPDKPALQSDMYLRVLLSVLNPQPLLVVPASSVHQGEVYLVGEDNRLLRRPVVVSFEQQDLAVISSGLKAGDHIIVDDIPMAINGMRISQQRDKGLENRLKSDASGESL